MRFLNNDNKGARLSSGALLGAVALHATALWWLIMQPQPVVRLPEVMEFALLAPTAQLEKVAPRPHSAPAQPPQVTPAVPAQIPQVKPAAPAAAEPEPQHIEKAQASAATPTAPAASAQKVTASNAVAALPVTATESSPVFDAAYLRNATPPYPALSRRLREEGRVMLQVRVDAQGLPVSVAVHASSGFKRLDSAAREAVAAWRFVPARRGAVPIEATVLVPLVFNLES